MLNFISKYSIPYLTFALIVSLICGCKFINPIVPGYPSLQKYIFSFEDDMEGWTSSGVDLDDPPVEWSVELSKDMAADGNTSAKFYLDNVNDAGKIWIERAFYVKPHSFYEVKVEYDFASSDWGDFNLFRIITGVLPERPESRESLVYQDDTGNDAEPESGYVWLNKSYDFTIKSDYDGEVYVIIGVWGTWETSRTYYVDNINITLNEVKGDTAYDLQGVWEVSDIGFDNSVVRTYQITIEQTGSSVKFIRDGETISTGIISGETLVCGDWNGYGISKIYIDDETSMHSEVPQNEFLNRLDFKKLQ
ncbi:hypothetical protein GF312_19830 [Candidatus Poribacteria bacterium]|nr:hypothetical protein [Candidatus Poribacteria bacterium]